MNDKTIVLTGLVGIGILIVVALVGILLLGDSTQPTRPATAAPAELEPRASSPAGERR